MDFSQQSLTCNPDGGPSGECMASDEIPIAAVKSENCSEFTLAPIKAEPEESRDGANFFDANYSPETPGNTFNIISKNVDASAVSSHFDITSDVNICTHINPVVKNEPLSEGTQQPLKFKEESIYSQDSKNLLEDKEDNSSNATEEISSRLSKNIPSFNYFKEVDFAVKTENNNDERVTHELVSCYPKDFPKYEIFDEFHAEETKIIPHLNDLSVSPSGTSEEIQRPKNITREFVQHSLEKENYVNGSLHAEVKTTPSCSITSSNSEEFCHLDPNNIMKPKEEVEEQTNITSELVPFHPQDISNVKYETDCKDTSLSKTSKLYEPDSSASNHQPFESSDFSNFSDQVSIPPNICYNSNQTNLKNPHVVLEDLFLKYSLDTKQNCSVHTRGGSCSCIFCAGSVKVKRKAPDVFEISSRAKPNECFIIREKPFSSVHCPAELRQKPKFESQEVENSQKMYKCPGPRCSEKFQVKGEWLKHLYKIHPDKKFFKCAQCTKKYKSINGLYRHERTHSSVTKARAKFSICPRCPAEFQLKRDCLEHIRTAHPDERPFKCPRCSKQFKGYSTLQIHKKSHSDNRPFSCLQCPSTFKRKYHLEVHISRHGDQKPVVCPQCPATFHHKSNLREHMARHSVEKKFACADCPMKFCVKDDLRRHLSIHSHKKPFACSQCPQTFKKRCNWRSHEKRHTSEKLFLCIHCSWRTNTKQSLKIHLRTHSGEKPYSCGKCQYKFSTTQGLKRHKLTHSDIKPFVCAHCPFKCKVKIGIANHMRLHTGEKPYFCKLCPAKFARSNKLADHITRHHCDNNRPHECKFCSKKYFTKYELNKHVMRHTNEKSAVCQLCFSRFYDHRGLKNHLKTVHPTIKPFPCSICLAKFKTKTVAQQHIKLHSNEKPFLCPKCPAKFRFPGEFRSHLLVHTTKRPYTCAHCLSKFKSKPRLRNHMETHSNDLSVLLQAMPFKI